MKKELSFYEFVGLLIPSTILLYSLNFIVSIVYHLTIIDFGKIGESLIFLFLCYGVGHILQGLGNIYENIIWFIYGGMPSRWLVNANRFNKNLFEKKLNSFILQKVYNKFGDSLEDYGKLTYNLLFQRDKTKRIDIFNGNYSLFRGLSVSFMLITVLCLCYFHWHYAVSFFLAFLIATFRMIRFAKHYSTETFRTFYNLD